ncbi:MAG: hypothetical protein A2X08_00380 [Bacteroidetes bacterium GWA2_32_17]|nr:MAG: hypothetical protein A2X08_00380 [Bacteroidetes bacterium GWA2_32_17]
MNGQQSKIDSILTLLKKDKPDTNKVIHTNDLCWEYQNIGKYDISLQYGKVALDLALQLNFNQGIVASYGNIGVLYMEQGDYPKALEYYFKGLKIAEKFGNKKGIARNIGNIGSVYMQQGDYPKALEYYFKVLKTFEEIGDKGQISTILGNIGIGYWYQGDYPKALEYYFKALKMHDELGNKNRIATDYGNIGSVYHAQKDYPKALEYYFKALKMSEEIEDEGKITIWLNNIGSLYTTLKKYDEAEKYLLKSLSIAEQISSLDDVKLSHQHLSELYEALGKLAKELFHYKKYITTRDSIFNNENIKKTVQAQMNYEFDKKEAVTKAEQDKKDVIAVGEKQKQKIITYSVSGGLFFVLLFAFFIFRGYRQKQKANIIITQQKHEVERKNQIIEEKNKDITDSINYAKRIQQATLPNKKEIYSALTNCFILFKPKDIVSGDFYFFHKNNQSAFIAAADCTGHGVPGAFMSIIGSEKLNDAVLQSTDTSEILKLLNKGIKISLRQSDSNESTRDGMDIALCYVDTENNIVKYAGANRPIWIIRKGHTEVEEKKATKTAIGGLTDDNQHFDTHELKLQQGDTFYIFSDGFADTFGGQEEKKLTTKKFKEILLSIQDKTMKEQEQHLNNFIENWKDGTEQADDILVIGVRL